MVHKFLSIKQLLNYDVGRVYLIEKVNESCGFFVFNGNLSFAVRTKEYTGSTLATALLDFVPSVNIESVENDSSFKKGFFDFLSLKSEENSFVVDFISLCKTYSLDTTVNFDDFIKGMIDLFQLSKRESKLNSIGLFGELFLIKNAFDKYKFDLSKGWHLSGAFSKYDFSFKQCNLEIKTSLSDSTCYLLKHSQVFNSSLNYICLNKIEKNENGISINDLIFYFQHTTPFADNLKFQIAIKKELTKSFDFDSLNEKYSLIESYFFLNKNLKTIQNVLLCITELEYKYNFDLSDSLNVQEFLNEIKDLM